MHAVQIKSSMEALVVRRSIGVLPQEQATNEHAGLEEVHLTASKHIKNDPLSTRNTKRDRYRDRETTTKPWAQQINSCFRHEIRGRHPPNHAKIIGAIAPKNVFASPNKCFTFFLVLPSTLERRLAHTNNIFVGQMAGFLSLLRICTRACSSGCGCLDVAAMTYPTGARGAYEARSTQLL